jgi:hypothetical protein
MDRDRPDRRGDDDGREDPLTAPYLDALLAASLTSIAMEWIELPDGSRAPWDNGIRIVDRTQRRRLPAIEHLVTWPEQGGNVVVMGLDASCRPVYITALQSSI